MPLIKSESKQAVAESTKTGVVVAIMLDVARCTSSKTKKVKK